MPSKAPALEKGLKILELVMAADEPLTLSRMAEAAGHKVSEIQRMVEYLASERYLHKSSAGGYSPGPRTFALADRRRDSVLVGRAEGPMRRFVGRTQTSVHIGVLVDLKLHVLFQVEGGGMVRVSVQPGVYDAINTVSGRLLLAHRCPGNLDAAEVERTRARGWTFGDLHCVGGVRILAARLALGSDPCGASIACPLLDHGNAAEPPESLLEQLRATAEEIAALC